MDHPSGTPPSTTPNWEAGARRRVPFYLLTALALAIVAAVLTYSYLERIRAASVATGEAVVARVDLRPGTLLEETHVELRQVPQAVLPGSHLDAVSQATGRVVIVPIVAGELLLESKLSGGPEEILSGRLPDGRWAMVLPASWMVSPVPELRVGDRIELMSYVAGRPIEEAGVIVSAIEVLDLAGDQGGPGNLTIAVTLAEAETILYARANGFLLLPLLRPSGS